MTKTPVRGNSNRFGKPVQMGTGKPVNRGSSTTEGSSHWSVVVVEASYIHSATVYTTHMSTAVVEASYEPSATVYSTHVHCGSWSQPCSQR